MATQNQKYLAELIGTFLLVLLGTSSVVALGGAFTPTAGGFNAPIGYLGIALTFGFTLVALAYTLGPISGGHFNPAVTLGLVVARRHPSKDLAPYWAMQILGAILASAVLYVATQGGSAAAIATVTNLGANGFSSVTTLGALVLEIVMTFVLVWVVLSVTEKSYPYTPLGGLAIGLALLVIHLADIGLSGAGVNPARSIGPAVFAPGARTQLWVYIIAPLIGAVIASGLYTAIFAGADTPSETASTTNA
jgi:aquaporin Z